MSERIVNVHEADYGGRHYRSTLEAKTAKTLDELGIPFAYEERKIELLPGFRTPFQKEKVRSITYTPDFTIGTIILECKGFETPEWKLKKKLLFKYLQENEPETAFYQIHDCRKSLLQVLDKHWACLGIAIEVVPKLKAPKKSDRLACQDTFLQYDSIAQAMQDLGLQGRNIGPILRSLTRKQEYVYNYSWKLKKIQYE